MRESNYPNPNFYAGDNGEDEDEDEELSEEERECEAEERAYLRRCHAIATCSNLVAYGIALEQARKEMREWQKSKGYI